ncbi:MAG: hypothetical protein ACRCWR_06205 [Saezia sp.]
MRRCSFVCRPYVSPGWHSRPPKAHIAQVAPSAVSAVVVVIYRIAAAFFTLHSHISKPAEQWRGRQRRAVVCRVAGRYSRRCLRFIVRRRNNLIAVRAFPRRMNQVVVPVFAGFTQAVHLDELSAQSRNRRGFMAFPHERVAVFGG